MTPKELKLSILFLAFQGKLVAQNKEEGTGTELLERLLLEKRFEDASSPLLTSISDEEIPFDIPPSWVWVRNKIVAHFINGRAYKKAELKSSGKYPVLRVGNLFTNSNWYFSDLELPPKNYCDKGDLLYSWSASFGPAIWSGQKSIFHYHIWKLDSSPLVDTKYLYYALLFDTEKIRGESHGLGFVFVTKKYIEERIMPLPPLAEQKRIVEKIESLMPLVDEYERVWTKLKNLNQSIAKELETSLIQLGLQGKLVSQIPSEGTGQDLLRDIEFLRKKSSQKKEKPFPSIDDDDVPFEIPQSWKWVRWGDLAESIQYGYNAPAKTKGRIKMVRISDIHDDSVDWPNVPWCDIPESDIASYLLKKNDILFARTGGTVGKAFLVRDDPEPSVYAGYLIRTRYNSELIDPEFLRYFMDSSLYWSQLRDGTIATAQPNCNGKTLSKMMLPLPPLGEQHRIVAELNNVFSILKGLHYGSEENK